MVTRSLELMASDKVSDYYDDFPHISEKKDKRFRRQQLRRIIKSENRHYLYAIRRNVDFD